jgi:tetratricopeptide (TPR) repeat protein
MHRAAAERRANAGELDHAVQEAQAALAIERRLLGEFSEDVVVSLDFLARLHGLREDWAAARKTLSEILALRQRQPHRKAWRIADARQSLADLDRRAALEPAQRQRLYEAENQMLLVNTRYRQGKYAEGIGPCLKATEIRGELLGENHPAYATSVNYLAELHRAMGDIVNAQPLYRQALEIRKRVLGENHPEYAASLHNLAGLYHRTGDNAQAEPLLRQALQITKRAQGENHPDYATRVNDLAVLYKAMGDYAKAEPLSRDALAITKRLVGENHPDYATRLNNLALLYTKIGDYTKADPLFRQALEIRKRVLGEDHPAYAQSLNNLALLSLAMGDYAKAEPLYRQALQIDKRVLGENHPDYAKSLIGIAELYRAKGDYTQAEPLLRQALEITKRVLGENHPEHAAGLNNLSALYQAIGDYAQAEPLCRQALDIKKRVLGENHPDYAASLINLAALYVEMGDYSKAEPLDRQALDITKRVLGENHPNYAISLNNLAALYQAMGDYPKAEPLFRQALEINKRVLGENHPNYAISLNSLGGFYRSIGDHAKSEPLFRQAMDVTKRVLGENHSDYARSLNYLALHYQTMGDYAMAEPLSRRALAIQNRVLGENHPDYVRSLNTLAVLYGDLGDYAKAEPLLRQALEITNRVPGESHPEYAQSLNNLAWLYGKMGDYAKAEPLSRRAVEVRKRLLGENHRDYATSLNNLAALYDDMGDYAKAAPLNRQALDISKRVLGGNHPDYATGLNNLAGVYHRMGDYAKAEPLFREALEIKKRVLGENHRTYGTSLSNLAAMYRDMGEYAKAEPLIRQALEINKRVLGENHPDYADSLSNLAALYQFKAQFPAAEKCLSQALILVTRWSQGCLTDLGERQRLHLVAAHSRALYSYLSVAPAAGIKTEELYRHVLTWKGVVEAHQDEQRLARDRPELKETLEQLKQARALLAQQAFTVAPTGQGKIWLQQLGALRERMENLDSDLARKSAAFRRFHENLRLGAAKVAADLPPGGVFVDLLDYVHFSPPVGGKGPPGRERRLLAFVLRRGEAAVLVPLGASRPIEQAVWDWREALEAGMPEPMLAAALDLARRVWEPLKPHLEGGTTVLVAPDGALMYFPLAALPGRRHGTYLLEDLAIGYVSSANQLSETLAAPSEAGPKDSVAKAAGLLAIGGIDYRADPGGAVPSETAPTPGVLLAESQRAGFKALAGTEPEARRISQLFGATFPQQHALVLTGAKPTEAAVKRELAQHRRYLHLATHGFFESPARLAALRVSLKSDGFGLADVATSEESAALELSPLLHSGLALVGAARKIEDASPGSQGSLPDRDDGILTAEEVQSVDLRGAELVVLSACETGLGHGYYGQGVLGLQRAFHGAGARAVVASMWKVNDAATSVLMEQFYTNLWVKKMSKLEALRQAQLAVLNNPGLVRARRAELVKRGIGETPGKLPVAGSVPPSSAAGARSEPSLWAAFVLSGDSR